MYRAEIRVVLEGANDKIDKESMEVGWWKTVFMKTQMKTESDYLVSTKQWIKTTKNV